MTHLERYVLTALASSATARGDLDTNVTEVSAAVTSLESAGHITVTDQGGGIKRCTVTASGKTAAVATEG